MDPHLLHIIQTPAEASPKVNFLNTSKVKSFISVQFKYRGTSPTFYQFKDHIKGLGSSCAKSKFSSNRLNQDNAITNKAKLLR